MGLWEQQVADLLACVARLAGFPVPQDTPAPGPTLPPYPAPTYQPVIPRLDGGSSEPATSPGMPRSTLDGIHGDGGVVLTKPGELGPYSPPGQLPYTEAPAGSGVWVPDHRPYPPGSVLPAGWSGEGADSAESVDSGLRRSWIARDEADQILARKLIDAHTADKQSKLRLQRIDREVRTGIAAIKPSLGTPAGRERLAAFLQAKSAEAAQVARDAQHRSADLASGVLGVGERFLAV